MKAWGEHQGAQGITMLADGDASFTKAIGLDKDTVEPGWHTLETLCHGG